MKVALLADTHWGVRGDNQIFLDHFARFHREVFFPYLDKHRINTVVHAGDLVDRRKFLSFNTANIMRKEYINPSVERELDTFMIAGNHDCYHKNNNEVNALQEFVLGTPGFKIYSTPAHLELGDRKILMLPWLSADVESRYGTMIEKSDADICFAHLELVGFEMAKGQMMEHGMEPSVFKKFKAVYSGHYHHKSSKGNIHYLGAPYEMTWADCDDPKGFHVLDLDTLELEFIENPFTLYKKVTGKVDPQELAGKIVKVVGELTEKQISEIEKFAIDLQVIEKIEERTIEFEVSSDTQQILNNYVDVLDVDVDKNILKQVLNDLYLEAQ